MNSQPRAVIADDAEEMCQLLSSSLEKLGVAVIGTYDNGKDVVSGIKKLKPDLCFLDIDMPQMTGFEVLDAIKEKSISTYPLIISGHNTVDNLKKAISKGAKGFVVKPYTFEKLEQVISKFNKTKL